MGKKKLPDATYLASQYWGFGALLVSSDVPDECLPDSCLGEHP